MFVDDPIVYFVPCTDWMASAPWLATVTYIEVKKTVNGSNSNNLEVMDAFSFVEGRIL